MSYVYVPQSPEAIREIAHKYLNRFSQRRYNTFAVDVEGMAEDMGFELVFRGSLGVEGLQGYAALDPRYIVVDERTDARNIRYTVAHELSHKILEGNLWHEPSLPDGAHCHELTEEQHKDIEENIWQLSAEIIEPYPTFLERFNHHLDVALAANLGRLDAIHAAAQNTAKDFDVITRAAARRARNLAIITYEEHGRAFTDKVRM